MRTKLLIIGLFVALFACATEPKEVSRIEVEMKGGTNIPLNAYHSGYSKAGIVLGLDFRYNLKDKPFDIGASFLANWTKGEGVTSIEYDGEVYPLLYYCTPRTIAGLVTAGYNLRRGYKVNPYAGLGIGVGLTSVGDEDLLPNETKAIFMPKIGIELMYNFRLELSSVITRKHFNSLNFTIGIVFGGRAKK